MPKIREYTSQIDAPGALNQRRVSGEDFGVGAGLSALGRGTSSFGDAEIKRAEQNDISDLTTQASDAHVKLTGILNDQIQKGTLKAEDFQKTYDEEMGKIGQNAQTYAGQQYFSRMQSQLKEHFVEKAMAGQAEIAGQKSVQDAVAFQNNMESTIMNDPSQFALAKSLHDSKIDALVATGGLPADASFKLKQRGAEGMAKAAVRGWMQLNPEEAKAQLQAGKWDEYIGGDEKKQLYHETETAINAKRIEAERQRAEAQRILGQKQLNVQDDFLKRINQGSLMAKDVLNSILDPVGSGSKKQFLDMLEASTDNRLKTDPATFVDLFNRIHAPEDDPHKIRDENDLNQFLVSRKLSFEDLNKLRGEVQGKKTAEGAIEFDLKKNVVKMAESSLTRTNPLMGIRDPSGDEQMQKFLSVFLTTFDAEKKKGKTAIQLLDPSSPDYLGKMVNQFTRTPQQIMKDMAKMASSSSPGGGLSATPAPSAGPSASPSPSALPSPAPSGDRARRPGESIQDYMKRVGK